jgi:ABC-type transport system involved in cytochrome bd biosynthesis fused ATPase/permease subunit
MPYYISPPPQNPFVRLVAAIIAVFVLVGSFMIGFAALLVVIAVGMVMAVAIWIRVAWIRHRMKKAGINLDTGPFGRQTQDTGNVIDAEYTVVPEKEDKENN